jgi:hypothetical protein
LPAPAAVGDTTVAPAFIAASVPGITMDVRALDKDDKNLSRWFMNAKNFIILIIL